MHVRDSIDIESTRLDSSVTAERGSRIRKMIALVWCIAATTPQKRVALRRLAVRSQPSPFARRIATLLPGESVDADASQLNAHEMSWLRIKVDPPPANRRAALRWGWIDATGVEVRDAHRERRFVSNYGRAAVQREMVLDDARTAAYARAVDTHAVRFRDAIVLDVGCGSGVLSLFAARAGARRVYCVEKAPGAAAIARAMVAANHYVDVITVLEGDIDELATDAGGGTDLIPLVDIIISEWMGCVSSYNAHLQSWVDAANRVTNAHASSRTHTQIYWTSRRDAGECDHRARPLPKARRAFIS